MYGIYKAKKHMKVISFIGFLYCLAAISLILLKFAGIVTISWGLVLAPLWIPVLILYFIIVAVFAALVLGSK